LKHKTSLKIITKNTQEVSPVTSPGLTGTVSSWWNRSRKH